MELVAMDMKQRGLYIARQLSFYGVAFHIDEVPLSREFIHMYNASVRLVRHSRLLPFYCTALEIWCKWYGMHFHWYKLVAQESMKFRGRFSVIVVDALTLLVGQLSSKNQITVIVHIACRARSVKWYGVRLSVCLFHLLQQRAVGLLLWTQWVGDINWLLHGRRCCNTAHSIRCGQCHVFCICG